MKMSHRIFWYLWKAFLSPCWNWGGNLLWWIDDAQSSFLNKHFFDLCLLGTAACQLISSDRMSVLNPSELIWVQQTSQGECVLHIFLLCLMFLSLNLSGWSLVQLERTTYWQQTRVVLCISLSTQNGTAWTSLPEQLSHQQRTGLRWAVLPGYLSWERKVVRSV